MSEYSLLQYGIISEVDAETGRARVYFDEDDIVSGLLPVLTMRALGDQITFPLDVNEHVCCLMDENLENGVILGAIFDLGNRPKGAKAGVFRLSFADNSSITYDRNDSKLTLDINGPVKINCDSAEVTATEKIDLEAPFINATGTLTVTGAATISGVASVGGLSGIDGGSVDGINADLKVKSLEAAESLKVGTIDVSKHTHSAPSGGGVTGPPIST